MSHLTAGGVRCKCDSMKNTPRVRHRKPWLFPFTCVVCGKEFRACRRDASTCGQACRQQKSRNARARKKAASCQGKRKRPPTTPATPASVNPSTTHQLSASKKNAARQRKRLRTRKRTLLPTGSRGLNSPKSSGKRRMQLRRHGVTLLVNRSDHPASKRKSK
jgi:hypothetical protein